MKRTLEQPISPLTKYLGWFAVFNIVLVTAIILLVFHIPFRFTALYNTQLFLSGFDSSNAQDSWGVMKRALLYVMSDHQTPLYTEIFFNQQRKFQYPPMSLLFLYLFRFLNDHVGLSWTLLPKIVSWIFMFVITFFSIQIFNWGKRKYLDSDRDNLWNADAIIRNVILFGLAITFYPAIKAFGLGQIQAWINGMFAIALWCWLTNRKRTSGVMLGLMCLIKPQYAIVLLWGLLRRQWSFTISFLGVFFAGTLISILWIGLKDHLEYLSVLSFISKHGETYFPNQSINGLLNRLLFNGNNTHWENYFPAYNPIVYFGTLISSAALVGASLFWSFKPGTRQEESGDAVDFSIVVLTSTMASPIAWEHHYGVLLPIYALLLPSLLNKPVFGNKTILWLGISYILTSNFLVFTNALAPIPVLNILQSYLFFGSVIVLVCLYGLKIDLNQLKATLGKKRLQTS